MDNMKKIFLDMDGVFVDFVGEVRRSTGFAWGEISNSQIWKRIWENNPNIFLTADRLPDALELEYNVLKFARDNGYEVEMLTAIPIASRFAYAADDKQTWLQKNCVELSKLKFNTGPHAPDKHLHAAPGDILIDDSHLNIRDWGKVGGVGIHHRNAKETMSRLHTVGHRLMKSSCS